MPIILSYLKAMDNDDQISILKSNLNLSENDSNKMYFMLDLILELDVSVVSVEKILQLLNKFKFDNDIVTLIFQYIDQFKLAVSQKQLLQVVHPDLPIEIRLQLLQVLSNIYGFDNVDKNFLNSFNEIEEKTIFIKDYFNYLKNNLTVKQKGLTVIQSMFYGDFEDSGKGNNGGLAVLLKSLGNEIATSNEIDLMVTITISKVKNLPFMHNYCNNHLFLRLPAYLNTDRDDVFLKREAFMKRFIKKHLDNLNINPDIYHIRYLDNASMAVAKLSKSLEKKLVLTLAPDPHRNVTDEFGHIRSLSFNQGRLISNKIRIGDHLINLSDKILGIGGQKVNDELRLYFPQFNLLTIEDKIKMIGEGIKIKSKNNSGKIQKVCELEQLLGIDQLFYQKPIILNVGRLADVKGQKALFNAFAN